MFSYVNTSVGVICNLLAIPLYLRHLGREEYGLWIAVAGVVAYLSLLNLGITQAAATRFGIAVATGQEEAAGRVVATAFWSYAVVVLVAAAALSVGAPFIPLEVVFKGTTEIQQRALYVLLLAGFGFLAEQPFSLFGGCLRAIGRIHQQQVLVAIQTFVRTATAFVYLGLGGGLVGLIPLLTIANILAYVWMLYLLRRAVPSVTLMPAARSKDISQSLRGPSFFYFVLQLSGALAFNLDAVVISSLIGTGAVAAYSVGQRLVFMALGVIQVFGANFAPVFLAHFAKGETGALRSQYRRAQALCLGAGAAVTLGLLVGGPPFMTAWVGSENCLPFRTFAALTLLVVLQMVLIPADTLLMITGMHRGYAVASFWEAGLSVCLTIAGARHWGLFGVATAKLASRLFGAGPFMILRAEQLVRTPVPLGTDGVRPAV